MSNNKIFLSEYFESDELDFFDANLLRDSCFFIDPTLVFNSNIPEFEGAREDIISFFANLSEMSELTQKDKAIVALKIKEPKENRLGYSKNKNGAGIGNKKANKIFENICNIKKKINWNKFNGHFEGFFIFGKDIGSDNISDFMFNILKVRFIRYTQRMLKENKNLFNLLKVKPVDNSGFSFEKNMWRRDSFENLPLEEDILFIPKTFLTKDIYFNQSRYNNYLNTLDNDEIRRIFNFDIATAVAKIIQKRKEENDNLIREKKKTKVINEKRIRNQLIKEECHNKPNAIEYFINNIDINKIERYDFNHDKEIKNFLLSFRNEIGINRIKPNNKEEDVYLHCEAYFQEFIKYFSSQMKIHKKLNEYFFKDEKELQELLKLSFDLFNYKRKEFSLFQEVKLGNGYCDFILLKSWKNEIFRLPIEMKLFSNKNWKNGYLQIKEYAKRENVNRGILLIAVNSQESLNEVNAWKNENKENKDIEIIPLDLILLPIPSKLKQNP